MEYFPAPLEKLVEQFARLPGIGGKSAQRLAFHILDLPESEAQEFAQAILDAKRSVTCCPECQNFTAGGLCPICASPKRDASTICVVADPRDVAALERSREYNGRYHVLHGVISPMNHVGPDDLAIKPLLERVSKGDVKEVIMATNPDTEGEATAMYLSRLLKPFDVRVTRPVGPGALASSVRAWYAGFGTPLFGLRRCSDASQSIPQIRPGVCRRHAGGSLPALPV